MRTILLSFSPRYYEILRSGAKVFEYRKRFCNEKVRAYIYLGKPIQQISGIAILDKRIDLSSWYEEYNDIEIRKRIIDFQTKNKYAMPILEFQEIEPINISEVKRVFPDFYIPLSFRNLDSGDKLTEYIENRTIKKGQRILHKFTEIDPNRICEM